MLQVPIDKILPVTDARTNISKLVDDVEKGDIYVLTRGGKPAVVVCPVDYIKKLSENNTTNQSQNKNVVISPQKPQVDNQASADNFAVEKKEEPAQPVIYEEKPTDLIANQPQENDQGNSNSFDNEQPVPVKVANNGWN
ncbi:hypothetical protein A3F08_01035 [Candidatus Berkelbacteria bacterium RIFCSPHIGHO2_12_FULL_36_9]|uniref:Antitoxin n=1 Tax=Candidatus Berkelbacteria bacterium RIFCSPHIGHO2_12_FULL_36_9 TaxID=1797469 RepID=A0A1F5EFC8_9BACT|nr:MAG: hypothetical protein A3F08_01035 [Candidatus Berkelbacteria bacterium RIFCSPHIGHO2_12_FULL_36_9]